jgi:predicted transcriptional regulator
LPFTSTVRDLARPFYELLEVYLCVDGPTPIADIETELGLDEREVVERIERLEGRGKVVANDGIVCELEEWNPES